MTFWYTITVTKLGATIIISSIDIINSVATRKVRTFMSLWDAQAFYRLLGEL